MSYYKTIDGKKMEAKLIDKADEFTNGQGDGRISIKEAEVLFELVKDGDTITDVERSTMEYIFENYHWTPGAIEWFNKAVMAWEAAKVPETMAVGELLKRHFTKIDVITDPSARQTRHNELEAATNETNADHDDIEIRLRLDDGMTVRVMTNFIQLEGEFVQLKGGCLVPVKAIEKIVI